MPGRPLVRLGHERAHTGAAGVRRLPLRDWRDSRDPLEAAAPPSVARRRKLHARAESQRAIAAACSHATHAEQAAAEGRRSWRRRWFRS
eukprot:3955064-Pleurochrysis_carterae.AAC.1